MNTTIETATESPVIPLSRTETLTLDAVNGRRTIVHSKGVFNYIDYHFRIYKANEAGNATKKTPVSVYQVVKCTGFEKIFGSFHSDVDKLCFTQHQIINFITKYKNWLRTDGKFTFFLFKAHGEYFTAGVCFDVHDSLGVFPCRFENGILWPSDQHRVVVPQLL
jgi:hypothetical protein